MIEINQFYFHRLQYLTSFWNILDLSSIGLNLAVVIMDLTDSDFDDLNAVACVAVLILWFRLFYLFRLFSRTAALISMIQAIVLEMR